MSNQLPPQEYPDTEHSQSGFASGFLLGLVVGGAGGYYLTTPQGRLLLKNLTAQAGDKLQSLPEKDLLQSLLSKLNIQDGQADSPLTAVKHKVNQMATQVAEATATEKPPKRKFFFQGGSPVKK